MPTDCKHTLAFYTFQLMCTLQVVASRLASVRNDHFGAQLASQAPKGTLLNAGRDDSTAPVYSSQFLEIQTDLKTHAPIHDNNAEQIRD
jgi:hypothetical protein